MPFLRGKRGQKGRQLWRAGCRHCRVLDEYRAAVDAWWARRESDESCGGAAPGTAGSDVSYHQLSDDEYRALFPMPLFRDFLLNAAEEHRQPEAEAELEHTNGDSAKWWPTWPAA